MYNVYICCHDVTGTRREGIVVSDEVRLFQIGSTNASPIQYDLARVANLMELSRSQKDQELPFFTFSAIQAATNDFAKANKLGEGGFGPVYKVIWTHQINYSTVFHRPCVFRTHYLVNCKFGDTSLVYSFLTNLVPGLKLL